MTTGRLVNRRLSVARQRSVVSKVLQMPCYCANTNQIHRSTIAEIRLAKAERLFPSATFCLRHKSDVAASRGTLANSAGESVRTGSSARVAVMRAYVFHLAWVTLLLACNLQAQQTAARAAASLDDARVTSVLGESWLTHLNRSV